MDIQKVNELEENNKVAKLVGMDNEGSMFSGKTGYVMANVMCKQKTGKGSVSFDIIRGIAEISTSKGKVVFVCLYSDFLLVENQHYTTSESDAIKNKKICITTEFTSGFIDIIDYTGEDLTIAVSGIGFSYADVYNVVVE